MGAKPSSIENLPQQEEPPDADVYDEETMSRFNSEAAESVKNRIKLNAKVGLALKRGSVHMASTPAGLVAALTKPAEVPKNPSARRGLGQSAHSIGSGASVLRDAPRNVFGPGHTFGPDVYGAVHNGDPHYSWLLELGKLQDVEKVACLETFIYFQGKMGVLLRECDTFSQVRDANELWVKLQAIISNLLGVPCMRVWQFDPTSRQIICVYNNGTNDAMVGRGMPTLGSMPGDVARAKKVLICNNCKGDSRFDGWQFKEMQATQEDELGSCIAAPLLSGEKDENGKDKPPEYVIEAYASDPEMVFDGSDVFLLTTLMSYAGPSHEAIKLQWQQRQVAKLPVMLLTHESLGGFVEACREMLRSACNAEDCEIFIVDEENTKSTKPEDLQLYVAEDRAKSAELDVIMKKAEELGKIMAKIAPKRRIDMSKGIGPNVGKRALQGKYATHIQNDPKKDQASAGKAANLEGYDLACDGGGVARRSVMTAPLVETGEDRQMGGGDDRLIGVVQLRTRIWRGDGLEEQSDKAHGFADKDALFIESMAWHISQSIIAARRKEEYRLRRIDAMMAEKRAHAIMTVTNLAGSASVMDDLAHVFTVVVQEIVQLLNCDRATFWRVGDGDEATLWTMVQPFPPTEGAAMIRIEVPMKEGTIAGSCVETEKTINIEDVYKDPRFDQRFDMKTGYRTRSMLAIPIQDKRTHNIKGCIQCMNKENAEGDSEGVTFNQDDIQLGEAFANILAVALEQQSKKDQAGDAVDMVVRNLV